MIRINVRTADFRNTTIVNETTESPKTVLEAANINPSSVQVTINGAIVARDRTETTFADLGYGADSDITLSAIVKSDGACD